MSRPRVHYEDQSVVLHHGDCLEVMRTLPAASMDAVVTDPPYGIRFMGKAWDGADIDTIVGRGRENSPMPPAVGGPRGGYRSAAAEAGRYSQTCESNRAFQQWCESWATECLRVLKPGGHMLVSGSPRTWHRLAAGIEDAGFEIRDSIAWLFGSGFPKSRNLSGEWEGWGTALKPGFEPIVVARKPMPTAVAPNAAAYGTGAINIDACRVGDETRTNPAGSRSSLQRVSRVEQGYREVLTASVGQESTVTGRWPTNVVMDENQASALDRQTGILSSGVMKGGTIRARRDPVIYGEMTGTATTADTYGDSGGASRFFPTFRYEAKAPATERPSVNGIQHPTVKPLDLMRWLVRLVTPPGGTVLEPFAGSGTTAEACVIEGFKCVAIERDATYLPLIRARLEKPIEVALFGEPA